MTTSASHKDLLMSENKNHRIDILNQSPPSNLKGKESSHLQLLALDDIEDGRQVLSANKKKLAHQLTSKSNGNMLVTMQF